MKVCTRCKQEKEDRKFRMRYEKRKKSATAQPFYYLNNTCRECDKELSRINYEKKIKGNPIELAKNAARVREYNSKNKEKIRIRQQKIRQTPEYKAYVRQYYSKNRERILEQHRVVCANANAEMRDWTIVGRLADKNTPRALIRQYPEIIEMKRLQLGLLRAIRGTK